MGMVFVTVPAVLEVTLALKAHDPRIEPLAAGTVPPVRPNDAPPATALTVPPQVVLVVTGEAMVTPAGRLSVSAAFVSAPALPLVIVIVSVETPPAGMEAG